ncbi:MAG: HAD family hydrolase [Verrucomicrobiota bacterium]
MASAKDLRFLFFDLDDTLIDHSGAVRLATNLYLHDYREYLPHSPEGFFQEWCGLIETYYYAYLRGEINYEQQRIYRMQELYRRQNLYLPDNDAYAHYQRYLFHYSNNWILFDDVTPFLEKLELPFGIITNGNAEQQRLKIELTKLKERAEPVIISEEIGAGKPDKFIFHEACRQAGVAPEHTLYIGDRFEADVLGGKKAGLSTVWLRRYIGQNTNGSVPFIRSLSELNLNNISSQRFNTQHYKYAAKIKHEGKQPLATRRISLKPVIRNLRK